RDLPVTQARRFWVEDKYHVTAWLNHADGVRASLCWRGVPGFDTRRHNGGLGRHYQSRSNRYFWRYGSIWNRDSRPDELQHRSNYVHSKRAFSTKRLTGRVY